jgi:hypothetical protein
MNGSQWIISAGLQAARVPEHGSWTGVFSAQAQAGNKKSG